MSDDGTIHRTSTKEVNGAKVNVELYIAPASDTIDNGTKLVLRETSYTWKRQDNGKDSFPPVNLFVLSRSDFASSPADRELLVLFSVHLIEFSYQTSRTPLQWVHPERSLCMRINQEIRIAGGSRSEQHSILIALIAFSP